MNDDLKMFWDCDVVIVSSDSRDLLTFAEFFQTTVFKDFHATIRSFTIDQKSSLNRLYLENAKCVVMLFDEALLQELVPGRYYHKVVKERKPLTCVGVVRDRQIIASRMMKMDFISIGDWQLLDFPKNETIEADMETIRKRVVSVIRCKVEPFSSDFYFLHTRKEKYFIPGDTIYLYLPPEKRGTAQLTAWVCPANLGDNWENLSKWDVCFCPRDTDRDKSARRLGVLAFPVDENCQLRTGDYVMKLCTDKGEVLGAMMPFRFLSLEDHVQLVLLQEDDPLESLCAALGATDTEDLQHKLILHFEKILPQELVEISWCLTLELMSRQGISTDKLMPERLPTLMHFAAFYNLRKLAQHLCSRKFTVCLRFKNCEGQKPHELASWRGHTELAKELADKLVDMDIYLYMKGNQRVYNYVDSHYKDMHNSAEIKLPLYISMGESRKVYYLRMEKGQFLDTYGTPEYTDLSQAAAPVQPAEGNASQGMYDHCEEQLPEYCNMLGTVQLADDVPVLSGDASGLTIEDVQETDHDIYYSQNEWYKQMVETREQAKETKRPGLMQKVIAAFRRKKNELKRGAYENTRITHKKPGRTMPRGTPDPCATPDPRASCSSTSSSSSRGSTASESMLTMETVHSVAPSTFRLSRTDYGSPPPRPPKTRILNQ